MQELPLMNSSTCQGKKCLLQVVGSDSREGRGGGEGREGGAEESLTDSTESKLTAEQYPQNRHIHL